MGKYYKGIVLLLCLLFASSAYAVSPAILQGMSGGGETEQEYGPTSVDSESTGWYDECVLQPAAPTTNMTVRYGWLYATTGTGSNNFSIAVYENSGGALGAQVGGCSDEGTITTGAIAWNQTSWSSNFPVLTTDAPYWICYWTDASMTVNYSSYGVESSLYDYGTGTCATEPTTPDAFYTNVTVSNHVAH